MLGYIWASCQGLGLNTRVRAKFGVRLPFRVGLIVPPARALYNCLAPACPPRSARGSPVLPQPRAEPNDLGATQCTVHISSSCCGCISCGNSRDCSCFTGCSKRHGRAVRWARRLSNRRDDICRWCVCLRCLQTIIARIEVPEVVMHSPAFLHLLALSRCLCGHDTRRVPAAIILHPVSLSRPYLHSLSFSHQLVRKK